MIIMNVLSDNYLIILQVAIQVKITSTILQMLITNNTYGDHNQ